MVAVISMLAALLTVAAARPAFGATIPEGNVDWSAARQLPPLEGPGGTSPGLPLDEPRPLAGDHEQALATTTRPILTAMIDPDPEDGYEFLVYDVSGAGGLSAPVAVATDHHADEWTPAAGLLEHGHVYAWTVLGADGETQDWGVFAVDLQRHIDQAFDEAGPFLVGLASGELVLEQPLGTEDDYGLGIVYRSSDPVGRSAGSTPFHVVSDGWGITGSMLGGASWYQLDIYGTGGVVVARSVDGTSVRYERDELGRYLPPTIDGVDMSFAYPTLVAYGNGTYSMSEQTGMQSTFASDGTLTHVEQPASEGMAAVSLEVTWTGGLLRQVTDTTTGRTASFTYLGEQACRPDWGFDTGSPAPALCSVTTFSGETIQLNYLNGQLSRVVTAGDAVTDFAHDESGHLTTVRTTLAADAVAAGVVPNDADATWRVTYDAQGRVDTVTTPAPLPGEASLTRSYAYGAGETSFADNGYHRGTVTFDPLDYRVFTVQSSAADVPLVRLYDEDHRSIGFVDERGLQTSWSFDAVGNMTEAWGPAPQEWFGSDGRPLASHADQVPTSTTEYGAGAGALATFADGTAPDGTRSAVALLTTGSLTSLPGAVDTGDGWRMTVIGDALLDIEDDTKWRIRLDDRADVDESFLMVDNVRVEPGETAELPAPDDVDPEGRPTGFWLEYVSPTAPTAGAPAWFAIEYSHDGETWIDVDPSTMLGNDLPTQTVSYDVFGAGQAAEPIVWSTQYSDPLLGLASHESISGGLSTATTYEAANPAAGQFARPLTVTNQAGLTTVLTYWGDGDVATHPITGESLPQYGRMQSIQVGGDVARGTTYDASGRPVEFSADGVPTTAFVYDERGWVTTIQAYGEPARVTDLHYGAGGDPRVVAVTSTVGDESFTSLEHVDLLGRAVSQTDAWGTTTTTTHDALGIITATTTVTADGATTTTTHVVDPTSLRLERIVVDAADGNTYTGDVGYDGANRITSVAYSNGVSVAIGYDAASGMVASRTWTDGEQRTWVDEVERTSQSGRILSHRLDNPLGSSVTSYQYEPATGALVEAALVGAGNGPESTTWTYSYSEGMRTGKVTTTAAGTVRLDYDYDANMAPVGLVETTSTADSDPSVRDVPVAFAGTDMVTFDDLTLAYDNEGLLIEAGDGHTSIELTRDATGQLIRQLVTTSEGSTITNFSGPFTLDQDGNVVGETVALPGGVTVFAANGGHEVTWDMQTLAGDPWWSADNGGAVVGEPVHFSPDGEQLTGASTDPLALDAGNGWRAGHGGVTLPLDTTITLFGARAYIPTLGMFTTMDPIPGAGPTPYSYADNDPVNLVDPTGNQSEGPFDDWNSPGWQLVITIGLTFLGIVLGIKGQGKASAAVFGLLALYLGILSADAYMRGDYVSGTLYAVTAVITLTGAVGVGARSAAIKGNIFRHSSMSRPVSPRAPSLSTTPSHSSGSGYASLTHRELARTRWHQAQHQQIAANMGHGPPPAPHYTAAMQSIANAPTAFRLKAAGFAMFDATFFVFAYGTGGGFRW